MNSFRVLGSLRNAPVKALVVVKLCRNLHAPHLHAQMPRFDDDGDALRV